VGFNNCIRPNLARLNPALENFADIALNVGLLMPDGDYRDVFIRAESLTFVLSNGRQLALRDS
jgi:hypothetical protein